MIVREKVPTFTPISFEVTVESLEELQELWHRLNVPVYALKETYGDTDLRGFKYNFNGSRTNILWMAVNEALGGKE